MDPSVSLCVFANARLSHETQGQPRVMFSGATQKRWGEPGWDLQGHDNVAGKATQVDVTLNFSRFYFFLLQ